MAQKGGRNWDQDLRYWMEAVDAEGALKRIDGAEAMTAKVDELTEIALQDPNETTRRGAARRAAQLMTVTVPRPRYGLGRARAGKRQCVHAGTGRQHAASL